MSNIRLNVETNASSVIDKYQKMNREFNKKKVSMN